jgi:signal peptidase I
MTKKNKWLEEIKSFAIIIAVISVIKSIFIANYTVPTGSMEPIILPGDKLIVNKIAYKLRVPFTEICLWDIAKPEREDVIVFTAPPSPDLTYVKRLIGLPGDRIRVRDGFVRVNDKDYEVSLSQEELEHILMNGGTYTETGFLRSYTVQRVPHSYSFSTQEWTVPEGHYFAMGDNRDRSADSREWGFVPEKYLLGKAKMIYFSLDWPDYGSVPVMRTERIGTFL